MYKMYIHVIGFTNCRHSVYLGCVGKVTLLSTLRILG